MIIDNPDLFDDDTIREDFVINNNNNNLICNEETLSPQTTQSDESDDLYISGGEDKLGYIHLHHGKKKRFALKEKEKEDPITEHPAWKKIISTSNGQNLVKIVGANKFDKLRLIQTQELWENDIMESDFKIDDASLVNAATYHSILMKHQNPKEIVINKKAYLESHLNQGDALRCPKLSSPHAAICSRNFENTFAGSEFTMSENNCGLFKCVKSLRRLSYDERFIVINAMIHESTVPQSLGDCNVCYSLCDAQNQKRVHNKTLLLIAKSYLTNIILPSGDVCPIDKKTLRTVGNASRYYITEWKKIFYRIATGYIYNPKEVKNFPRVVDLLGCGRCIYQNANRHVSRCFLDSGECPSFKNLMLTQNRRLFLKGTSVDFPNVMGEYDPNNTLFASDIYDKIEKGTHSIPERDSILEQAHLYYWNQWCKIKKPEILEDWDAVNETKVKRINTKVRIYKQGSFEIRKIKYSFIVSGYYRWEWLKFLNAKTGDHGPCEAYQHDETFRYTFLQFGNVNSFAPNYAPLSKRIEELFNSYAAVASVDSSIDLGDDENDDRLPLNKINYAVKLAEWSRAFPADSILSAFES